MSTFKKTKVVMLPTNEKAEIGTNVIVKHNTTLAYGKKVQEPYNMVETEQHLYFLSDEEIKEGDWCYDKVLNVIFQTDEHTDFKYINQTDNVLKIIATTDKSLTTNSIYGIDSFDASIFSGSGKSQMVKLPQMFNLPQPSQSFIEKFVDEYNKGNQITEVLVEYEVDDGYMEVKSYLKVNSKDNTITIRKAKDSWSREEVIELLHRRMEYTFGGDYDKSTTDKWIEENL